MKKILIKLTPDGKEHNYGQLPDKVISNILKGFSKDLEFGFYEKKGVKSIYLVLCGENENVMISHLNESWMVISRNRSGGHGKSNPNL